MKLISKRAFFIVLVPAIVCLLTRYALCYWDGFYQRSWDPIFFQQLLALFGLILVFIALIICVISCIKGQQFAWATALLACLLALYFLPSPHDLIIYGLRDGLIRNYGLNNIRHFARDFDQLPNISENNLDGKAKFYWNKDLTKSGLKEKYPFLIQCAGISEWENKVCVNWGGFEDHWMFIVALDGKKIAPENLEPKNKIIQASDDVFFQSDY